MMYETWKDVLVYFGCGIIVGVALGVGLSLLILSVWL